MTTVEHTSAEIQIARMSREFRGENLAQGATEYAAIATRVAKAVHDDDLIFVGGNSLSCFDADAADLSRPDDEYVGRETARGMFDWSQVFDLVSSDRFRIFVGPVQIDRSGACNISVIGDWARPTVQLIGSRGLPDDVWRASVLHFHLPKQTVRNLVERVDFVSSFGNGPVRDELGCVTGRPGVLVTDLAVYHWPDGGDIAVESIHPGVSIDDVRANTGFDLHIPRDVPTTEPPSAEELDAIRRIMQS